MTPSPDAISCQSFHLDLPCIPSIIRLPISHQISLPNRVLLTHHLIPSSPHLHPPDFPPSNPSLLCHNLSKNPPLKLCITRCQPLLYSLPDLYGIHHPNIHTFLAWSGSKDASALRKMYIFWDLVRDCRCARKIDHQKLLLISKYIPIRIYIDHFGSMSIKNRG